MFQNLRQGSEIYILHKSIATMSVEVGVVETTNMALIQYYPGMQIPNMGVPVDITVRVGEKSATYRRLPATCVTAEGIENSTGEQVVLACTKEALLSVIQDLRQKSTDQINSIPFHQQRVASCDQLYNQLNPEAAAKAAQEAEMQGMREEMAKMREQMSEQAEINRKLLEKLNSGASSD